MKKRDYIQHAALQFIVHHYQQPDATTSVRWAENLWHKLNQVGYGDSKQHQPRENKLYYNEFSAYQKEHFDQFWNAWNDKSNDNRNGAAMRWYQLGEAEKETYQLIIAAATAYARQRPEIKAAGGKPKMAQGWLHEKRYDGFEMPNSNKARKQRDEKQQQLEELKNKLNHAISMIKLTPDDSFWKDQKEQAEKQIQQQLQAQV